MTRRPTARRSHRIMSPTTLPALRQPHPSHSPPSSRIPSSREGGLLDLPLRASNEHYNAPSKLARYSHCGMALVVVLLRPSSEHIPIVRAPGA